MIRTLFWLFSFFSTLLYGGPIIVIDPGHGGLRVAQKSDGSQEGNGSSWNNATAATFGILEKNLTLEYSQEIAKALAASPRAQKLGAKAILTRNSDSDLSAMGRAAIAVENTARVFLSIHFNGSATHTADGTRGYIVSRDHPHWEFMHFVNPYAERDRAFSDLIVKNVAAALQPFGGDPTKAKTIGDSKHDGGHLKDGIRTLGFARQDTHLYQAVVMLLEVEFIDNPKVAAWLLGSETRDKARQAVASSIVTAICDHLEKDKPPTAPLKAR
jgi:N-acetylmuramoyl-L-alanine amidase